MAISVTHTHVAAGTPDSSDITKTEWNAAHTVTGLAEKTTATASGNTMNTARLLGRTTSSSGAIEEITAGVGITLSAGSLAGSSDKLVQMVFTETGGEAHTTTAVPYDDTIPQNTEGAQVMTCAITPQASANTLIITVVVVLAASAATRRMGVALFQDTTAGALAAIVQTDGVANAGYVLTFRHIMAAGTTSATTFKVRIGQNTGGLVATFNGSNSAGLLGGTLASSIMIEEYI